MKKGTFAGRRSNLKRRHFLKFLGLGVALSPLFTSTRRVLASSQKRNIILILTDDHRYDMIGCLSKHPSLKTPNLDRLVKNGMLFENGFVTTSLCSPSRASILTGQYAHTHGIINNSTSLPDSVWTFPQSLQKAGYKTAFVGKWHMGRASDEPRPGFDRWVSFRGWGKYYDNSFNIDGTHVQRKEYVTDVITEYSIDFIRKNKDKPFFLYMSHKAVHSGFTPAARHQGEYRGAVVPKPVSFAVTEENYIGKPDWVRRQRDSHQGVDGMMGGKMSFDTFYRKYCECLMGVDDSIGELLDALQKEGLLDDTLIIYLGDNGYQFGEHGLTDKRTMYEASIRIPYIVHCPALIGGGGRRKEMVLNIDVAPTILDAAGASIPGSVQGRSILPLIKGKQVDWRKEFLYEYFWERVLPMTPTVQGIRTEKYSFMHYYGICDIDELYDLEKDPDQMHNLLGGFPASLKGPYWRRDVTDPKIRAITSDLQNRLFKLIRDTGGTIL